MHPVYALYIPGILFMPFMSQASCLCPLCLRHPVYALDVPCILCMPFVSQASCLCPLCPKHPVYTLYVSGILCMPFLYVPGILFMPFELHAPTNCYISWLSNPLTLGVLHQSYFRNAHVCNK